jgi:GT2 family glycosyltransferase
MPRRTSGKGGEVRGLSVVVPAYRAERTIGACLDALFAAGFAPGDIVVVDDGSPDATIEVVRARGIEPVVPGGNRGAAEARNAGAAAARGDVLFFVDADVTVHADARDRLVAFFKAHPGHAGVFGSYDAEPPGPSRVSRIRNLLHHHVHQRAAGRTPTFWTGCGAVRRADLDAAGGFRREDEMIEDVGLGLRLARLDRPVFLDPDLLCTHLKQWTWRGFFATDYRHRAMPWTRMLLDPANRGLAHVLNAGTRGKAAVVATGVSILGATSAIAFPVGGLAVALGAVSALAMTERRFLGFVARRGGWRDTTTALAVLWMHYLAAGAGYARVRLLNALRSPAPGRR